MKKWLCVLLALLMLCAGCAVQAEEQKIEYIGGVVLRTFPKGNEAPGDEYINVGYVECSMPYLLLDHVTSWTLGIEGGQAPYVVDLILWRRPFDATDEYYWYHDGFTLEDELAFNYVFQDAGSYFWQITVTDSAGQTLVFQTRPQETAASDEESNAQTAAGKVNQIIREKITAGMSEYQRALVLHDWLIYNANYDYTPPPCFDPEGVLLYGSGVCDSYARAYQMLCTAAGLECIYVTGQAGGGLHGWNLVKIDGQWYHVDCTWDDPGEGGSEHHGYFLLTDEEMGRDHDWNMIETGDMIVPDAEDTSFEGGASTDCDFTFTTMADCTAAIRAMKAAGNYRQSVVGLYTGNQNIYEVYEAFDQWADSELGGILGSEGWWSSWSASGDRFLLTIEWNSPAEYVRFDAEKVFVSEGESKVVAATDYYPAADAFTWVSSDPSVAAVSSAYSAAEGLTMTLTGVSGGTAVITVTSKDGASDSVEVVVMPALAPDMHVEEETTADGIHLIWPVVPGVTEYHVHIMIEGQTQEECVMILEDHEAYLTNAQLPANEKHEVWIVGRRVVDGEIVAEYCGEHKHHSGHSVSVTHTPVTDAAVAPTCTASGLTQGSHCAVCGVVITAQEVIPALGHDEFMDWGAEPTCTLTGLSVGSHCSRCGVVIIEQEVIPALGHVPVTETVTEAGCTTVGLQATVCGRCLETLETGEIHPLGHEEFTVEGVPATHVSTGLTDLVVCTRCGEVLQRQEPIPVVQVERFSVPGMVQRIDAEAFAGCRFVCVVIGEGCRSIGASAFADNPALRFVEIPASVTSIDASAFDGCSEELIIVTKSGSAAEAFARQNGMLLVIH